jgi:hypothetical protein
VAQEADILNTLGWRLQFISIYDVLTHFLCQGIVFTSDKIHSEGGALGVPTAYTAGILQHNAEVFTSKCLKKHEFLKYDQLTLVCGIIMSSRKVCKFVELWPEELVAMTGNRLRYPQIKSVMRHILSFYDEISCSVTASAQSSPEHPSTVQ